MIFDLSFPSSIFLTSLDMKTLPEWSKNFWYARKINAISHSATVMLMVDIDSLFFVARLSIFIVVSRVLSRFGRRRWLMH